MRTHERAGRAKQTHGLWAVRTLCGEVVPVRETVKGVMGVTCSACHDAQQRRAGMPIPALEARS